MSVTAPKERERITSERLRELVSYDADTGAFTWRVAQGYGRPGKPAGTVRVRGYLRLSLDQRPYRAHRLAWLYVHGKWPVGQLDHINGIRDDNRLCNLREATAQQNAANKGLSSCNRSGFKGVHYCKSKKCWRATIRIDGRTTYLGAFSTPEAAGAVYAARLKEVHGEFARIA